VAAIDIDGKLVDLGPKGHTSERWNAATGVKGEVHTWVSSAEHVARVAGYTDGLGVEHVPTDADIARLMELWAETPPGDDASLFDVRLAPSPETTGQDHAPEPGELRALEFEPDSSRPIVVPGERSPVARVDPIEAGQSDTAVEGWRPLAGEEPAQPPTETPAPTLQTAADLLQKAAQGAAAPGGLGEPTVQQIQMWQQAALLGLTSAALAMLMVERLIKDQQSGGKAPDAGSQTG
jgi:hypothetical protein